MRLCIPLGGRLYSFLIDFKNLTFAKNDQQCCVWCQEVVIEGQDKVYKDVIEPLESVSVNLIPTSKQTIKDFGPPKEVSYIYSEPVLGIKS